MKWRCLLGHQWEVCQHALKADYSGAEFVLAWKQCRRCAKSRLIHILQ